MKRLVLFDIDGTLLTTGRAARDAFAEGLVEVYGYDGDVDRFDFSGRTDPEIASMILTDDGWNEHEIRERLQQLWEEYLSRLARTVRTSARVLPGMRDLVDALSRDARVTLALLTGNIEPGARLKLGAVDLNEYFPFGAFGSDSPRRELLPPIAVARAHDRHGHRFSARDVVIIGDSIFDVRCGVPHDARTIAIASGKTARELLAAEKPDHLFDSAEDGAAVMEAIFSE
jgi:phosphoglycolate phosphatase-like HAD superfamily hydrolase